jgi:hypothetical protein
VIEVAASRRVWLELWKSDVSELTLDGLRGNLNRLELKFESEDWPSDVVTSLFDLPTWVRLEFLSSYYRRAGMAPPPASSFAISLLAK